MTSPPAGVTVALADEANLYSWKVTMEGPSGSPYTVHFTFSFCHSTLSPALIPPSKPPHLSTSTNSPPPTGRHLRPAVNPPTKLPLQTPHRNLHHKDLPPQHLQRLPPTPARCVWACSATANGNPPPKSVQSSSLSGNSSASRTQMTPWKRRSRTSISRIEQGMRRRHGTGRRGMLWRRNRILGGSFWIIWWGGR